MGDVGATYTPTAAHSRHRRSHWQRAQRTVAGIGGLHRHRLAGSLAGGRRFSSKKAFARGRAAGHTCGHAYLSGDSLRPQSRWGRESAGAWVGRVAEGSGDDVVVLGPASGCVPEGCVGLAGVVGVPGNGSMAHLGLGVAKRTTLRFLCEHRFDLLHLHAPLLHGPARQAAAHAHLL